MSLERFPIWMLDCVRQVPESVRNGTALWSVVIPSNVNGTQLWNRFYELLLLPWLLIASSSQTTQQVTHAHLKYIHTHGVWMYFSVHSDGGCLAANRNFHTEIFQQTFKSFKRISAWERSGSLHKRIQNDRIHDFDEVHSFLSKLKGNWNYVLTYQQGPENSQWRHNMRALSPYSWLTPALLSSAKWRCYPPPSNRQAMHGHLCAYVESAIYRARK